MPDTFEDALDRLLCQRLIYPLSAELRRAAREAVLLTRADLAERLVDVPRGPSLPAGTLVEVLGLDGLADREPR